MPEERHCDVCGSDGHHTDDCCHCGSSRHKKEDCKIAQKAKLMLAGVPPEHLFDAILEQKVK